MRRELLVGFVGAIAGIAIGILVVRRIWHPATPTPAKVQVDTIYMEGERVPVKPTLGQKLTTAVAKPTQTRVADKPSAQGKKAVADYCDPTLVLEDRGRIRIDSTVTPTPPPPARLPDFQGRRVDGRLSLYSTLNDGRRWSADYSVRGRISWRSDGDSVIVRGDRLFVRIARGSVRCAPAAAASGAVGFLLDRTDPMRGLALGTLSAALGCLR